MNITKINNIQPSYNNFSINQTPAISQKQINKNTTQLSGFHPAFLAGIHFTSKKSAAPEYRLNLSMDELKKRTSDDYLQHIKLLSEDSTEYQTLKKGDKLALKHLVKAANVLDNINKKLDSTQNLPFEKYLDNEIKKGNKKAELTKILYDGQKGIFALDRESNKISLAKGLKEKPGRAVYPDDLSKEEFHDILNKMLDEGKDKEVKKILSQRTVVERKNDELVGIDYVDKYKPEFSKMADELEKASKVSTNKDFNEYLKLQAKALRKADPMLDAKADIKWAQLQDTPLEFTITRENYDESMTESIFENEELSQRLKARGINPVSKDFLGGRVGIVNKKGTDDILRVKEYLPIMAAAMPLNDKYVQAISTNKKDSKQTMVDVDLVALTGDVGSYRAGITIAENLPNNDKLSQEIGGGKRNVYHRQVRMSNGESSSKRLDAVLDPALHKYYDENYEHLFTVGHENGHSLGPKKDNSALGKYKHIIEENKADMVSLGTLDALVDSGLYTEDEKNKMIVTFATNNLLKSKPDMSHAHRVRSAMQTYYFMKEGAMNIDENGILSIKIDKMVPTAQKMLKEIVEIQLDNDINKAEKYVTDNFQWTDRMQKNADNLKQASKTLNGTLSTPLADKLSE